MPNGSIPFSPLPMASSPYLSSTSTEKSSTKHLTASAKEFESILLTQWLQSAESSFASVPGDDADDDGGGEQLKAFGTQFLARALSDAGGIGIGSLVAKALAHADHAKTGTADQ